MSLQFVEVAWDDARAVRLRESMDAEMGVRYAGSGLDPVAAAGAFRVEPADVVCTVLAVDTHHPSAHPSTSTDTDPRTGTAVGHAALRRLGAEWEIKRVVVCPEHRGRGIAARLMAEVEAAAARRGAERVILQTGDRQPEAVSLYTRLGYTPIPIYPPYRDAVPFSLCFAKRLSARS